MTERRLVPTQSALLELKEERAGLQEGYGFLDEKRLILAAEILAEIGRYEREKAAFDAEYAQAAERLRGAVMRHGLEGLEIYPAAELGAPQRLTFSERRVLGVALQEAHLAQAQPDAPPPTLAASPEADACRAAFQGLIPRTVRLAAMTANLERLRLDYARTARRARALEDVLLPEVRQGIEEVGSALEELEREESVRARFAYRG